VDVLAHLPGIVDVAGVVFPELVVTPPSKRPRDCDEHNLLEADSRDVIVRAEVASGSQSFDVAHQVQVEV